MSEPSHPRQDVDAAVSASRRCAECGAVDDEASRAAARRGGRVVLCSALTVLVALLVVAAIAHRGREQFRVGGGVLQGRAVSPTITWDDVRRAAAGTPAGAGLFEGVHGLGEPCSVHVPAELRLWSEFTVDPQAMDRDFLRSGKGAVTPLRWTEVLAMGRGADPDRALAQRLVDIHRDRAIDPAATLKITPDLGVVIGGEMSTWSVWMKVVSATRMRYVRDSFFGSAEPVAPEPRVRVRPGLPQTTVEVASADPGAGVLTIELDLRGAGAVLAGAVALGLLAWFAFGGLRARRMRQRAVRGECLACGYPLGP